MDKPYLDTLNKVLAVHEPSSYNKAKDDRIWVNAMQQDLDALDSIIHGILLNYLLEKI